jgi:hypothetical protein
MKKAAKLNLIRQKAPLVLWTNSKLRLGLLSVPARVARFGIGGACCLIKKLNGLGSRSVIFTFQSFDS